jgi:hypothetical protein
MMTDYTKKDILTPQFIAKVSIMIEASFVCINLGIETAFVDMHSENTSFRVHRRPRRTDSITLNAFSDGLKRLTRTPFFIAPCHTPVATTRPTAGSTAGSTRSTHLLTGKPTSADSSHDIPHSDLACGIYC